MPGAVTQEVQAFATRIDAATSAIAAKLTSLRDQLANAGTVAEVDAILKPVTDALEAVAADPANPLPPVTNV